MDNFIMGLLSIIAFIGMVYLGFKVIVLFFRTSWMILKMDTNPKKPVEEKLPYTPVGDLVHAENVELRRELATTQKEIESLTKGRVLYEKLVVAELQIKKQQDAFEEWRKTDGPDEKADMQLCEAFKVKYDPVMLRRYVADELRLLADVEPINGNHIAQARVLLAAENYDREKY